MPARVNVGVGDLELVTVPSSRSGGRHHGAFLWCSIDQAAHGFVDHGCGALETMGGGGRAWRQARLYCWWDLNSSPCITVHMVHCHIQLYIWYIVTYNCTYGTLSHTSVHMVHCHIPLYIWYIVIYNCTYGTLSHTTVHMVHCHIQLYIWYIDIYNCTYGTLTHTIVHMVH